MKTNGKNLPVEQCPHCGVTKPLLTFVSGYYRGEKKTAYPDQEKHIYWLFYTCSNCKNAIMAQIKSQKYFVNQDIYSMLSDDNYIVISIFPQLENIPEDLPDSAANFLRQASTIRNAPDGCVMLAASSVDAMLKGRGLKDGTLHHRINEAAKQNIITKDMADWAHSVRLDANDVRHADDKKPHATEQDAEKCLVFAKTLGEILFTLPKRISDEKAKNVIPQEE